jgi:hypothetical protein
MSIRLLQSTIPQENQTIRVNDATIRGNLVANGTVSIAKGVSTNAELSLQANTDPAVSGKIIFPAMTIYTQLTSQTTAVSVANGDQQFIVDTFAGGSIPAGTSIVFNVNNPSIVLDKTIVVMNKMGSTTALTEVNDFVSVTASGGMTITRHNFGGGAGVGLQRLCFKLIQTV